GDLVGYFLGTSGRGGLSPPPFGCIARRTSRSQIRGPSRSTKRQRLHMIDVFPSTSAHPALIAPVSNPSGDLLRRSRTTVHGFPGASTKFGDRSLEPCLVAMTLIPMVVVLSSRNFVRGVPNPP